MHAFMFHLFLTNFFSIVHCHAVNFFILRKHSRAQDAALYENQLHCIGAQLPRTSGERYNVLLDLISVNVR